MSLAPPNQDVKGAPAPGLAGRLPGPGPLLVGVSGGADSVACARLLALRASQLQWQVVLGHVDHQLRPDSHLDAEFTRELAAGLGLGFKLTRVDCRTAGDSPEAAARAARRQALRAMAHEIGAGAIALAHTADDQAETILGRALTGTGLTGLAGMRVWRGIWWRPLLFCRRQQLRAWLESLGQPWREDPSNQDQGPLRNRLRLSLLPLAEELINPRVVEALGRLAELAGAEEDFWRHWCAQRAAAGFKRQGTSLLMTSAVLRDLHPAQLRRLLRHAAGLVSGGGQHLLADQLARLVELWQGRPGRRATLGAGLEAWREPGGLRLDIAGDPPVFSYRLDGPGSLELPHLGLRLEVGEAKTTEPLAAAGSQAWLPAARVNWPLTVRSPQAGERFHPLGAPGSKRLSRFFIDRRVPPWWRRRTPVVADAAGTWWVAPWSVAERARRRGKEALLRLRLVDTKGGGPYTW